MCYEKYKENNVSTMQATQADTATKLNIVTHLISISNITIGHMLQ